MSGLLFGAQCQVEVQLDLGFGHERIGPPHDRYRYSKVEFRLRKTLG